MMTLSKTNMNPEFQSQDSWNASTAPYELLDDNAVLLEAEQTLKGLAEVFFQGRPALLDPREATKRDPQLPSRVLNVEERYRALVEQIPAVVFMAYLDKGIGEAYVSPQIEAALGFSQKEWLEDPMRWYQQIHPADKQRWSAEAAEMFLSGQPLKSAYRVLARDRRVLWFHCEAKMIRREDGQPWIIHGVGKRAAARTKRVISDSRYRWRVDCRSRS
jgi:PAS domain S-box-containing protein